MTAVRRKKRSRSHTKSRRSPSPTMSSHAARALLRALSDTCRSSWGMRVSWVGEEEVREEWEEERNDWRTGEREKKERRVREREEDEEEGRDGWKWKCIFCAPGRDRSREGAGREEGGKGQAADQTHRRLLHVGPGNTPHLQRR